MHWTIRNQILVPFSLLLLLGVLVTATVSAVMSARRSDRETAQRLRAATETLSEASFPFTETVLARLKGLSGAEFVYRDHAGGISATTLDLPADRLPTGVARPETHNAGRISEFPLLAWREHRYFWSALPRPGDGSACLFVLYPERSWRETRWHAVWPPLIVGLLAAIAVLVVAAWLARRLAARLDVVRGHLQRLAQRDYHQVTVAPPRDELFQLQVSANELAVRLESLEDDIRRHERLRLLAQLASGLAHQLRNAVTGAHMALQLHRRRCPLEDDESLDVAQRQLGLVEQQLQGLLALGSGRERLAAPGDLRQVVDEVQKLVTPICCHMQVELSSDMQLDGDAARVSDVELVRAALINMVTNAVEAAGPGGRVRLGAECREDRVVIRVEDTGAGPPEEIAGRLGEPFVSSKAGGVGLGLALARQVAEELGGALCWRREQDRTVFCLDWPRSVCDTSSPSEGLAAGEDKHESCTGRGR